MYAYSGLGAITQSDEKKDAIIGPPFSLGGVFFPDTIQVNVALLLFYCFLSPPYEMEKGSTVTPE